MTRCKHDVDMSGVDSAFGDLVAAQLGLGKELLKVLGAGSALLIDSAKGISLPEGTSCCDIPEPCWMPRSLGEVCCTLCPGDTGEVCLDIVNEDFRPHNYEVKRCSCLSFRPAPRAPPKRRGRSRGQDSEGRPST